MMLVIGSIVCSLFTVFSIGAAIIPLTKKFRKFLKVKADHQSLPADADESSMQKSIRNLQDVAAEVHKPFDVDELLALFETNSDATVRRSLPPLSTFRSSSRMLLNSAEVRQALGRMASYQDLRKKKTT